MNRVTEYSFTKFLNECKQDSCPVDGVCAADLQSVSIYNRHNRYTTYNDVSTDNSIVLQSQWKFKSKFV